MKRFALLLVLVLCLSCLGGGTSAQTQTISSIQAVAFVQSFYDWYLPIALNKNQQVATYTIAITRRPELFEAALLRALRNDAAAQARAVGEIDGLDWDPFVATNGDPAKHFKAFGASGALVALVGYDERVSKPLVTLAIEVRCKPDHCVIVNVHYPAQDGLKKYDLLATLRLLHPHVTAGP